MSAVIDFSQLQFRQGTMPSFKAGLAQYATNHNLPYAPEFKIPSTNGEVTDNTYYGQTYRKVVTFLNSLGAGQLNYDLSPSSESAGTEGYMLKAVDEDTITSSISALHELCHDCHIPKERITSAVESLALLLDRYSTGNTLKHFDVNGNDSSSAGYRRLNTIYPSSIVADATYTGAMIGKEMFGINAQQKIVDIKTAMTITLIKNYKGLTNRLFHRVTNDTGFVMFIVPNDEFYDLAKSQAKTSAERDSWSHRNQLITLRTHPEPVDMELIPVVLRKALDVDNKFLLADNVLLPDTEVSLWDMSMVDGKAGYNMFNYTDLLSNQIVLRAVHIEISDGAITEQYLLNLSTAYPNLTTFTHQANTFDNQADRICNFNAKLPFSKDTVLADGNRNELFKNLNTSLEYIIANVRFTANTNLQSTKTHGMGSIEFRPALSIEGATLSTETKDLLTKLTVKIIGWEIDAKYSEENFRKTNMAVRSLSDVYSYSLPDGRTIVADHSHRQTLPEHTLKVASEVQTIGIDHRNVQIMFKTLRATAARIKNERSDPRYIENYDNVTVSKAFVSGRKVVPTIATKTIDMSKVVNFKSTDMFSDIWTYMRACMNAITTEMNYRSLLPQALEDSTIKYKVLTTTPLLDAIWCLSNIHENQMPGGAKAEDFYQAKVPGRPVEFKTKLPNGVELEFITSSYHYLKDTMIFIPYRENSSMDDLNFAINLDGGQYSVNWSPTDGNNMTIRRSMQNTREYPIVLCGIGGIINVQNYDVLTLGMFEI